MKRYFKDDGGSGSGKNMNSSTVKLKWDKIVKFNIETGFWSSTETGFWSSTETGFWSSNWDWIMK